MENPTYANLSIETYGQFIRISLAIPEDKYDKNDISGFVSALLLIGPVIRLKTNGTVAF